MNYGMNISCLVEEELRQIDRPQDWTQADEAQAYDRCLKLVLEQNGRAWADGNIRIGDYILLSKFTTSVLLQEQLANGCQLIQTLVCQEIVFWMRARRWSNLPR